MCSWEEIGEKWNRAQQMGYQAIQAALDVGDELQFKKNEVTKTVHSAGEFSRGLENIGVKKTMAYNLMRLALHRNLIEEHKPESMQRALLLLPKVPTKTSEKQLQVQREEVDKFASFAKEPAKRQAEILAKKQIKIELERLQNQAHDAVMTELKAVRSQLTKERQRVAELMADAAEKQQFWQDLINKRGQGHDFSQGLKLLRQALHPDRLETAPELRTKAMDEIKNLAHFLGV